ncbi:hypothetical protein QAD02_020631 [Eretmocerus hayati]|uniref:Uncharacterized protein n=1 Tax=Eretmocerus hayati TaxID=131215 RepID=A0ACC2PP81_9HYME|nr:hypothetical protein QAD02_020631 [Eretmocerus hayati]
MHNQRVFVERLKRKLNTYDPPDDENVANKSEKGCESCDDEEDAETGYGFNVESSTVPTEENDAKSQDREQGKQLARFGMGQNQGSDYDFESENEGKSVAAKLAKNVGRTKKMKTPSKVSSDQPPTEQIITSRSKRRITAAKTGKYIDYDCS